MLNMVILFNTMLDINYRDRVVMLTSLIQTIRGLCVGATTTMVLMRVRLTRTTTTVTTTTTTRGVRLCWWPRLQLSKIM